MIIARGSAENGSIFNQIVGKYIEETAASIVSISEAENQFVDSSNRVSVSANASGQGGPESLLQPSPIQNNSFLAYNPPSEDYLSKAGVSTSQILLYEVQPGDNLSFIASDYGVSVNTVIWANSLKNIDSISPGQVLKIPPVSGVVHAVKKGDTVAAIAKKYGADESRIMAFNSLPATGEVREGDELVIPDGKISSAPKSSIAIKNSASVFSHLTDLGEFFKWPATGFNWGKIHGRNGVDVANACGTPIYASADGTVTRADASGWNGGFGKVIKLSHSNGTETLYAHNNKLLVNLGQQVSKGEQVASMGSTGRSTGCHLHFEVHGARNPLAKYSNSSR